MRYLCSVTSSEFYEIFKQPLKSVSQNLIVLTLVLLPITIFAQDWFISPRWQPVVTSGEVTSITLLDDNSILATGRDGYLYTLKNLYGNYEFIPNSASVKSVSKMPDGTIVAVGSDNQVYYRRTLNSPWALAANSYGVNTISARSDGTLLATGVTDHQLYLKSGLNSPWTLIPNSSDVISVSETRSNRIFGIAQNFNLYLRESLYENWTFVADGVGLVDVIEWPDGSLVGVGTNGHLYKSKLERPDYTLTILEVTCIKPSAGTDGATDAFFLAAGAIAGAAATVGTGGAAGPTTMAYLTASAGAAGTSGTIGKTLGKTFSGSDDLYIKVNGGKAWPNNKYVSIKSQQTIGVGYSINFMKGQDHWLN